MNRGVLEVQDASQAESGGGKAINAFTDHVTKALKKGDKLTLPGFGTFSVAKRKARVGKNPRTGEAIKIPATKVARFKAGNLLKGTIK